MPLLNANDFAPDFVAQDMTGKEIRLSDLKGKKILLCFFRYATCPFCTVRFVRLAQEVERYARSGLVVLGVFESSSQYIEKYISRRGLPFPVIPDPDGRLYALYGVRKSMPGLMLGMLRIPTLIRAMLDPLYRMASVDGSLARIPADFLISENGEIVMSYYGGDIGDHIPFKSVDAFAESRLRQRHMQQA
ncbi:MAG: redoxin domain-containing protein [Gammaproteobacteria bacterium]